MGDLLSSDILEQQFGPTEISVLHQDGSARLICTRASADGQVLEVSRVRFMPGTDQFPKTHQAVLDGQSMGKAFRADGIKFERKVKTAYRQFLPASFNQWFDNNEIATVVAVSILVGPNETRYAEILEIYSPAV